MEVQIDVIVVGEKQGVHSGRVSHAARGRVLTRGTETGTLHDSEDFLIRFLDTLWCPVLLLCSQCFLVEFCAFLHCSMNHLEVEYTTHITISVARVTRTSPLNALF